MLKFIGCSLIILSGFYLGFLKATSERKKLKQGMDLKRFLYYLEGEIRYSLSTLPDAIGEIQKKTKEDLKPFLSHLKTDLNQYQEEKFSNIWLKRIKLDLEPIILEKKFLEPIKALGENIGYLDQEMQLKAISFAMEQLEDCIYEIKEQVNKNCKMYQVLGISFGIFVVIFLL